MIAHFSLQKKKKKELGNVFSFSKSYLILICLDAREEKRRVQKRRRQTSGKTWEDANVNSLESIPSQVG